MICLQCMSTRDATYLKHTHSTVRLLLKDVKKSKISISSVFIFHKIAKHPSDLLTNKKCFSNRQTIPDNSIIVTYLLTLRDLKYET